MKKFIEKTNHMCASNVASALGERIISSSTRKDTGKGSHISASIARNALTNRVTAMKKSILRIRLVSADRLPGRALVKRHMMKRSRPKRLNSQLLSKTAAMLKDTSVGFARRNLKVR